MMDATVKEIILIIRVAPTIVKVREFFFFCIHSLILTFKEADFKTRFNVNFKGQLIH